jgi:predicted ATPase
MDYAKEYSANYLPDDIENLSSSLWKSRRSQGKSSEFEESLCNTTTNLKKNENIQKLTINKLQYDSIGLVGREREVATLKACLDRLLSEQYTSKELVFLNGYSGAGKSTLANTLVESTDRITSAICGRGKFDLNNRDEPYSGIASAFGEIFRMIATRQGSGEEKADDSAKDIGHTISSELGSEVELLVKLIPELQQILPATRRPSTTGENAGFNTQAEQERWKYAFRVLTRVLNSYSSPVVLVLDDLQWADASSLGVVDYLLSDTQNTNELMIVGLNG